MVLERINKAGDIKNIDPKEYGLLAQEIREKILEVVSKNGGHLASSLGVVELTMALHLTFDIPTDKLIWDVGHQSYTHKLLTGRAHEFGTLRTFGGISGFPRTSESDCDPFDTGHSSTSISAGLGFAHARDAKGEDYKVISVIGDGALTGGMAMEALNNASQLKSNFIIVLNDNNMSIAENVGGISTALGKLRTAPRYNALKENVKDSFSQIPKIGNSLVSRISRTKNSIKQLVIPGMIFEDMDITYLGPVDGYDIDAMRRTFEEASRLNRAVLVHVITKKGKGYEPAEKNPERFHGIGAFDLATGNSLKKKEKPDWTDVFAHTFMRMMDRDPDVVAITAAMPDGTGLSKVKSKYPDRVFDVGIAEQHAVTFAAGLAAGGLKPYFCVYSSFLQRGFDQIIHDVCLASLDVKFCIDRAGLVGNDGDTHQGIFDLSFLSMIPNMTVMAPKNRWELADMLKYSRTFGGPLAIRYARGQASEAFQDDRAPIEYGRAEWLVRGQDVALLAVGTMVAVAGEAAELLKKDGIRASVINARFVSPVDADVLREAAHNHRIVFTLEENVKSGGFGEHVAQKIAEEGIGLKVKILSVPDGFVQHGSVNELRKMLGLDAEGVYRSVLSVMKGAEHEGKA